MNCEVKKVIPCQEASTPTGGMHINCSQDSELKECRKVWTTSSVLCSFLTVWKKNSWNADCQTHCWTILTPSALPTGGDGQKTIQQNPEHVQPLPSREQQGYLWFISLFHGSTVKIIPKEISNQDLGPPSSWGNWTACHCVEMGNKDSVQPRVGAGAKFTILSVST